MRRPLGALGDVEINALDAAEADAWVTCFINGSSEGRGVKGDSERKGAGVAGATDVDIADGGVGNAGTSSCRTANSFWRLPR